MVQSSWSTYILIDLVVGFLVVISKTTTVDPKGYILYCPCMGRFGNQADMFLGALRFAYGLDRTLVLPPWVEYRPGNARSVQIPFDTYFKVEPFSEFHRVMTMEHFMKDLAPRIWPVGKRTVFCYGPRNRDGNEDDCAAKDGNPFGSFWDTFNIDFDASEFYGPLYYNTENTDTVNSWNKKYPSEKYPVMAFTGTPGAFPVAEVNVELHKYLVWSDFISDKAEQFIASQLPRPYLGIHLRQGSDWKRVCEHISSGHLFASAQCLGYRMEHGQVTEELCFPPQETVLGQTKQIAKKIKAKSVFVASDTYADHLLETIQKHLKGIKGIKVVGLSERSPHVDLAILGRADHYIGNCLSTFSAIAARERKVNGNKPTSFWSFNYKPPSRDHDEF